MSSNVYLGIRISRLLKRQLLEEAMHAGETLSELVRRRLDPYGDIRHSSG